MAEPKPETNCLFYGKAMFVNMATSVPFLLLKQNGNQCGLIRDNHVPCRMELDHLSVDWRECPLLRDVQV